MADGGASWDDAGSLEVGSGNSFDPTSTLAGLARPYFPGWWSFTAGADALVTIDTLSSVGDPDVMDTIVSVFSGADEGSSVLVAENDDAGTSTLSSVTFKATSGTTYHVRVGTYDDDGDTVTAYVVTMTQLEFVDLEPIAGSEEVLTPGMGGPVYPFPTSPIVGGDGCLSDSDDATYLDLVAAHEDGEDPEAASGYAHLETPPSTPTTLLWSLRAAATLDGTFAWHPFDAHDADVVAADLFSGVSGGITGSPDSFDADANLSTYATLASTTGPGAAGGFPVLRTEWLKMAFNPPTGEVANGYSFTAAVVPASGWDPTNTTLTICVGTEDQSTFFYIADGTDLPTDGTPVTVAPGFAPWITVADPSSGGVEGLCATGTAYLWVFASGWSGTTPPDAAVQVFEIAVGAFDSGNVGAPTLELDIVSKDGAGSYGIGLDYGVDVELTADGTFYDYTGDFTAPSRNAGSLTLDDLCAYIAEGGYIGLTPNGDGGSNAGPWMLEVFVSELAITAAWAGEVITFVVAPLRQYPRDDGLAASAGARNYPPPKSYQFSNRQAGGYL